MNTALFILTLTAILVVGGAALGLLWAFARWCLLAWIAKIPPGPGVLHALANQVVPALEQRHPEHHLAFAAAAQVRRPWSRRISAAVRAADAGGGSFADHLLAKRVLPQRVAIQARAAAAAGAGPLLAWWRAAGDADRRPSSDIWLAWVLVATLIAGVIRFISEFIAPKFHMIYRDLGIAMQAQWILEWVMTTAVLVVAIVTSCGIWSLRLRQPDRRTTAGRILLDGMLARRDLSAVVPILTPLFPKHAGRLQAAAAVGDVAGVAAGIGWRAGHAPELARALERAELRRAWRHRLATLAAHVVMPVLLAVPVGLMAYWIFANLVGIVVALDTP